MASHPVVTKGLGGQCPFDGDGGDGKGWIQKGGQQLSFYYIRTIANAWVYNCSIKEGTLEVIPLILSH